MDERFWERITPYSDFLDERLTEEEIRALTHEEGKGIVIAPMKQYDSLEEFTRGSNNFHNFFTSNPESLYALTMKSKKAYQRYEVLYPEAIEELSALLASKGDDWGQEAWEALHAAYKDMSTLVDMRDKHVVVDDKVDDWYLCR